MDRRKKILLFNGSPYPSSELYRIKDATNIYQEVDSKGLWTNTNSTSTEPPSSHDYTMNYVDYTTGTLPSDAFFKRWEGSVALDLPIGTKVSMTVKVKNVGDINLGGATYLARVINYSGDVIIGETVNNNLYAQASGLNNLTLSTDEGIVGSISNLYDTWITISGTLKADVNTIPYLFTNTGSNRKVQIREIVIGHEVISFNNDPNDTTFISEAGTLTFTPRVGYNPIVVRETMQPINVSKFGSYSIPVTSPASIYGHIVSPEIPVKTGENYRVSIWARVNRVGTQKFRLWEGATISDTPIDSIFWKEYVFNITATDDILKIKAYARVNGGNVSDTVELDGLSIIKTS